MHTWKASCTAGALFAASLFTTPSHAASPFGVSMGDNPVDFVLLEWIDDNQFRIDPPRPHPDLPNTFIFHSAGQGVCGVAASNDMQSPDVAILVHGRLMRQLVARYGDDFRSAGAMTVWSAGSSGEFSEAFGDIDMVVLFRDGPEVGVVYNFSNHRQCLDEIEAEDREAL